MFLFDFVLVRQHELQSRKRSGRIQAPNYFERRDPDTMGSGLKKSAQKRHQPVRLDKPEILDGGGHKRFMAVPQMTFGMG